MKMFAQDGYGSSDKIKKGLEDNVIQGALLSPRYRSPDNFIEKIDDLPQDNAELFIDPAFHAYINIGKPNAKLGKLEEWNYFSAPRRSHLISGIAIDPLIENTLLSQKALPVAGYVSPNIFIENANSIDAGIAQNMVSKAKNVAQKCGADDKPVFASLALHRDVLSPNNAFNDMVEALTAIESPPDGFYVLIGSGSTGGHIRSDIFHGNVIAGWMYLNYALSINGFKVINGYSDLLSPLLGICGAYAGASGWFGSLRQFSMNNYIKPASSGGSTPLIRYVSTALMARIKQTEYDDFIVIDSRIANGLSSDDGYNKTHENETTRCDEALQSWDALSSLSTDCITGDIYDDLDGFLSRITTARQIWSQLEEAGLTGAIEAHLEKLSALESGIQIFREWAELT